jgi:ABC-type nitrate/sulfonate/bicarbonate transport system substrate-binding protein
LSRAFQAGIIVGMPRPDSPADLVEYLVRSCSLNPAEAARVIADVLGYYSEAPEEYVRRRHRELKARGLTNDQAFDRISAEMPLRRYAPPDFSLRQLRRIVYG